MVDTSTRRRVKLYMLNEDRMWDDRGTGHVSSSFVDRLKGMSLQVRSETDGQLLLESRIQLDTAYQKQQETLIVWSEADNYDLALSFQEKAGCDEIWEKICQVQGKDPSVDITQDVVEESEDERLEEISDVAPPIDLPPCELSKLEEISDLFSNVLPSPLRREKLAIAIENEGYIKKLIDLFHMCEDLDNMDGLHHLYDIFKNMFLLNKNALFEIMFSDDIIFDVIGVLEYDRTLIQPAHHREFLRTTAKFKEVIPFNNADLVQKIHQTYRVQYIQDVILPTPSVFEENMLSTLNSFIFFNKVEVVSMIQEDENFLKCLFNDLVDDDIEEWKRRDLVLFLKEYCTLSKTLQPQKWETFFKTLTNMGILSALEIILAFEDDCMKLAAIDIFSYVVEYSPPMVREFILQEGQKQDDEDLLINLVIEQMINDTDPELGGAVQLMGILRVLIDPENMVATANKTEKTEFLSFFYKHSMHILTAPLFANTADNHPSKDDYQTAQLLSLILELLTFCIEHHTYHIKNYVINKDLLRRILVLLKSKHGFLALCALRLMRRVIGLKDEFYSRYIIRGDLFAPVVAAFLSNGQKYNLLNSAMIEMFDFIVQEDVKSLLHYIVEQHHESFNHINYVKTFQKLKERYDLQESCKEKVSLDGLQSPMQSMLRTNQRFRRDQRTLDEEEENYFDQEDEIDDTESLVPINDNIKNKLDDFDYQINRIFENKKAKENENLKETITKPVIQRSGAINISINKGSPPNSPTAPPTSPGSPMGSPLGSPISSPVCSPGINLKTPFSSPNKEENKSSLQAMKVGLVDYPDEDSEEEEEDDENVPLSKRPRIST